MTPVHVSAWTVTSALGRGRDVTYGAMRANRSGLKPLQPDDFGALPMVEPLTTWVGHVDGLEAPLPAEWARWDCRNNRLAWAGLQGDDFVAAVGAARDRHGPERVGVVMGTSTASIGTTEDAYRMLAADGTFPCGVASPELQSIDSLTAFIQAALALTGPGMTVSTACSSSAKAFCTAARMLHLGVVDAVLVGGVDSLCASTLFGFNALELVSAQPCTPFAAERAGINLGEAAAFALLERGCGPLQLLGHGESSDAHHLSAPDPEGAGAELALADALARAGIDTDRIDHVQLHGTATRQNDEVESRLLTRRYTAATHASSSKGMVGHTLGAAGVMGSVFCWLALESGLAPGTANTRAVDPALWPHVALTPGARAVRIAATHNFAFGGSNCVLIWGCGDAAGGDAIGIGPTS